MKITLLLVISISLFSQDCDSSRADGAKYSKEFLDSWNAPQMVKSFRLEGDRIISKDIRTGIDTIFIPTFLEQGRIYKFEYNDNSLHEKLSISRLNFTDVCYKYKCNMDNPEEAFEREGVASISPHFWYGSESVEIDDSISPFGLDIFVAEYYDSKYGDSFLIRISYPDQLKDSKLLVWIHDDQQKSKIVPVKHGRPLEQVD